METTAGTRAPTPCPVPRGQELREHSPGFMSFSSSTDSHLAPVPRMVMLKAQAGRRTRDSGLQRVQTKPSAIGDSRGSLRPSRLSVALGRTRLPPYLSLHPCTCVYSQGTARSHPDATTERAPGLPPPCAVLISNPRAHRERPLPICRVFCLGGPQGHEIDTPGIPTSRISNKAERATTRLHRPPVRGRSVHRPQPAQHPRTHGAECRH